MAVLSKLSIEDIAWTPGALPLDIHSYQNVRIYACNTMNKQKAQQIALDMIRMDAGISEVDTILVNGKQQAYGLAQRLNTRDLRRLMYLAAEYNLQVEIKSTNADDGSFTVILYS